MFLDGEAGVQRRVGILENDLHLPPDRLHVLGGQVAKIDHPVRVGELGSLVGPKEHPAPVRLDQAGDAPDDRRFVAATLAGKSERLARIDREAHTVHGPHLGHRPFQQAGSHRVELEQVLHPQDRRRLALAVAHGSVCSCSQHLAWWVSCSGNSGGSDVQISPM